MNSQRYRIVFNRNRGQLMAVAETATAQGKSGGTTRPPRMRLPLLLMASGLGLGAVLPASAQIVAHRDAPGNQRATVLVGNNGVPVVNVQTPSGAGVSRNTYSQFDVQGNGAVLNNSRSGAQTELAGQVAGNPWMARGTARIIVNEVVSDNPSQLRGAIEVGGERAEVIIANPAGIDVDGAGFINTSRATLTTGAVQLKDGQVQGYVVRQGKVTVEAGGLDASGTDYAAILARAVEVNGEIHAQALTVVTGTNEVSPDHKTITPIDGSGPAPAFALDVSALGGMYAGKISLVGTEAGVGVRNAGKVVANAGEVRITADGKLHNSGLVHSTQQTEIQTQKGVANSGTVYARTKVKVVTQANIDNSGLIGAQEDTTLIAEGETSRIDSSAGSMLIAGLNPDGTTGVTGTLTMTAEEHLHAGGVNQAAEKIAASSPVISLGGSTTAAPIIQLDALPAQRRQQQGGRKTIGSSADIAPTSRDITAGTGAGGNKIGAGDIDLSGATILGSEAVIVNTRGTLRTDKAVVVADTLSLSAQTLSNRGGQIVQTGDDALLVAFAAGIDNSDGAISGQRAVAVESRSLQNDGGAIHAGGRLSVSTSGRLDNGTGVLTGRGGTSVHAGSLSNAGLIDGGVSVGSSLDNAGTINGSASAGSHLDNSGSIAGSASASSISNSGAIKGGALASGRIANSGSIGAGASAGTDLANSGYIAGGASAGRDLSNSGSISGAASAGQDLSSSGVITGSATSGRDLTNSGHIGGHASAGNDLANSGSIAGSATAGRDLSSSGRIGGNATAGRNLDNAGLIAGSAIAGNDLSNSGLIAGVALASQDIDNSGAIAGEAVAGRNLASSGVITGRALAGQDIANSGLIAGLAFANRDLGTSGTIVGDAVAGRHLVNRGTIGGRAMADEDIDNGGIILDAAYAGQSLINSALIDGVALAGSDLDNSGAIGGDAAAGRNLTSSGVLGANALAGNDLDNNGLVVGSVLAGRDLANNGTIAGNAIAANTLGSTGVIAGNAIASSELINKGRIGGAAQAGNNLRNSGTIAGSASAKRNLSNQGTIAGSASAGDYLGNSGRIAGSARGGAGLSNSGSIGGSASTGGHLSNSGGIGGSASGSSLSNSGHITGSASGASSLSNSGSIGGNASSGGTLSNSGGIGGSASGSSLTNSGHITGSASGASSLSNSGSIGGNASSAGNLSNQGHIDGSVSSGANLDNGGTIGGSASAAHMLANSGAIGTRGGTVSVSAGNLANTGSLGGDALYLSTTRFDNNGGTLTAEALHITATDIDNRDGVIRGESALVLVATGEIDNTGGALSAGGLLALVDGNTAPGAPTLFINNTNGHLQGEEVILTGATLDNRGGQIIGTDVRIGLGDTLDNTRGQIGAAESALIVTGGDLINDSGQIEAGAMHLEVGGSLYNRTLVESTHTVTETLDGPQPSLIFGARDSDPTGPQTFITDVADTQIAEARAAITTHNGDLTLKVGGDLVMRGAELGASGQLLGQVSGNIDITGQTLTQSQSHTVMERRTDSAAPEDAFGGTSLLLAQPTPPQDLVLSASAASTTTILQSDIHAGGDVVLLAGANAQFVGTDISAGGGVSLVAGGNLGVAAQRGETATSHDTTTVYAWNDERPSQRTEHQETLSQSLTGGHIHAGGDVVLGAGNVLALSAADISAGGHIGLTGRVVLSDAQALIEGTGSETRMISGPFSAGLTDIHSTETMVGTRLSAGGDILVVARVPEGATGEEATAAIAMTSVTLEAGGRIGMAAEGDVLIDGTTRRTLDDTRNSSGSNIDSTLTNSWVASSLSAQAITISGEDVTLVGAHLASPGVTRIAATGDLALDAGVDHRREHHLSTRSSGAFIEKLRVDETLSESVLAHPTHIAASQVQLVAGGDLDLYASQLVSREAAASLVAGGEVNLWAVEEQHYTLERHETSTNFLGWIPLERQAVSDSVFESGARVAHLQSEGAPTLAGGGDIRLQGTVIESPEAPVITPGVGPQAKADAQLILEGVITRTVTEHHEEDTNIAWQRLTGHGSTVETLTLPQIQAGLSGVRAPGGIVAQIPEGDLNTHISQLSQQPGTAWVGELAAMGATDPVLWQPVALAYETWAYEQEGLSPAASAIIAVAVAIGTQGMGAKLFTQATGMATTAATATGVSYTLVGVMANAGFSTLVGQASIAFVNNKGDIGATLKALGSSGNVRSLVTSIVTAGMTNAALFTDAAGNAASLNDLAGLTDLPGMGTKLASLELANLNLGDLALGVGGRALVNAGVSHLVQGVDLGDALRLSLSADLGALGASGIGSLWGAGKDPVLQSFAHALLGCGAASLAGADCAAGAVGGATESVLGNVLDVELGANGQYDKRTQFLYTAGAILSASLVADGLGLDTSTAIGAAQNAALNNRMLHPHEKELAKQLHKQAQEEGLPYSLEEIEDALRWAANDALREGVVSAPIIIDANTSADAVYDVDTLKLYNPNPGVSQPVLYQDMNAIAPPSEGLINFVQGHTGSTYSWNPTLWQAQAPTSAQHGADQRYAGFVADGKLFSLPVVDCPASSCANESSIAWFSDNPADQVNLAAFAAAVDTDIARGVLTIGSSALIPASGLATGLAGEVTLGAGLGGLFDLAGQWYGGNEFKAWQTVTSMATGAAAYPLGSSSSLYNGILGGTVGAINTQTTNLIYDDEASVISAFGTGFLFSGGASILANWTSKALAGVLPTHLDGNPHNPSVAILLQNVGQPNPYPEYAGFIIDQTVSNMPSFLSETEAVQEP